MGNFHIILSTVLLSLCFISHSESSITTKASGEIGSSPVNLTFVLSGSNLPKKDRYSEVDAFVKLFYKKGKGSEVRFGTTDKTYDDPNPEWHQVFWFSWEKGTEQKWHFVVRDHDRLAIDDSVGDVTIDVDDYVANGQEVNASLSGGGGYLIVKKTEPFKFRLSASNIPSKDGENGKSDAYVRMYWRRGPTGTARYFRKSAVIHEAIETYFEYEEIEFPNWQKGTNQYLYFQLYDRDTFTTDDFIGDLQVEVDSLVGNKTTVKSPLDHSDGKATLSIYLV